jgi:hypothetical protein
MSIKTVAVHRALGWTGVLVLLTGILFSADLMEHVVKGFPHGQGSAAWVFLPIGIGMLLFVGKSRPREAFFLVVLLVIAAVELANFTILPQLDGQISARHLAESILKTDPTGGNVALYQLPRSWQYGMNFYMNRDLPEWVPGSGEPEWILANRGFAPGSRYEVKGDDSRTLFVYRRK